MSNENLLEVTDLAKSYRRRAVVDSVSMQVRGGEIVGLLGPNGAGKTTTLRMLYSLLPPDAGEIRIDGLDPTRDAPVGVAGRAPIWSSAQTLLL